MIVNIKRGVFLSLFALCFVVTAMASGSSDRVYYSPAGAPTIEYLEGEVLVNGDEAFIGDEVTPGSLVQVGEESLCEIETGNNIMRIYENTLIVLEMDANRSNADLRFGAIGAVFEKVQKLGKGGTFNLTTPTVVGGVRGTVFYIQVEDTDNTYVCTCNGEIHWTPAGRTTGLTVESGHHSALRYSVTESGNIESASAGLLYHADREMEDIAAKIETTVPWWD